MSTAAHAAPAPALSPRAAGAAYLKTHPIQVESPATLNKLAKERTGASSSKTVAKPDLAPPFSVPSDQPNPDGNPTPYMPDTAIDNDHGSIESIWSGAYTHDGNYAVAGQLVVKPVSMSNTGITSAEDGSGVTNLAWVGNG